ncbi:multidrug resistance-associated protein 1 [Octopus bimaculoides]|uniref:ABC-type glutathione-S-conjugate transporter n=1 Tax=Octopus bimaculoides TaxID=37653 RepID=A0A0L8FWG4_OCTBM|nr:multidrug resistance-associated protein 1 [Octopus bimaculoides]|eukprot:XP_014786272.1 PREDICTED: multidrug resistance-associated protein 1-like [Octopus bimaculoides]
MANDFWEQLCGNSSQFWNESLLWGNEPGSWPQFTECFQNTVLIWIPTLFLWIITPFYVVVLSQKNGSPPRPMTKKIVFQLVLCVVLSIIGIMNIIAVANSNAESSNPALYLSFLLPALNYLLVAVVSVYERKKGIWSSYPIFLFWLLQVLVGIIPFCTKIILKEQEDNLTIFVLFYISYGLNLLQLLLTSWSGPTDRPQDKLTEDQLSLPSYLMFNSLSSVVKAAYRRTLQESDIPKLLPKNESHTLSKTFQKHWNNEMKSKKQKLERAYKATHETEPSEKTPLLTTRSESQEVSLIESKQQINISIIWILFRSFGGTLILGYLFKFCSSVLMFVNPMILRKLIDYSNTDEIAWKGYIYALGLLVVDVIVSVAETLFARYNIEACLRMRAALMCAVYKKALTISSRARNQFTTGEIVNMMSVDCERINTALRMFWVMWSAPLEIIVALLFLYNILGPSVFAGVSLLIVLTPVNLYITRIVGRYTLTQMEVKDKRLGIINQVLFGIKVLKLYAWESLFQKKISTVRREELNLLKKANLILSVIWFLWEVSPFMVMIASFATYIFVTGHSISVQTAFVSQSLFNLMKVPMNLLPEIFIYLAECSVSLKRVNKFLNSEDVDLNIICHDLPPGEAIKIQDGYYSWGNSKEETLKNINLTIPEGSLVALVGTVGSGKSSVLSCLLGDMHKKSGSVYVKGSVAYVPQEAWIQNATIKDNILFGKKCDAKAYQQVIDFCSLTHDLDILPGGDQTEIGEKGINLSGGQKQRVSLARASYADSDIYLLDDPLSAVDSHVGKSIFNNLISNSGLLKNKTRLLVTHGVHWLPMVDFVIVMNKGKITSTGTYSELIEAGGDIADFLNTYASHQDKEGEEGEDEHKFGESDSISHNSARIFRRQSTINSNVSSISEPVGQKLTEEESMKEGTVSVRVYINYIKAFGVLLFISMLFSNLMIHLSNILSSFWLTEWTENPYMLNDSNINTTHYKELTNMYLGGYGGFGLGVGVSAIIFSVISAYGFLNASTHLHERMLTNIMAAPLHFFDVTPLGRITNRFSFDTDMLDNLMPEQIRNLILSSMSIITTMFAISYFIPLFISFLLPLGCLYFLLLHFYIPTARQLQRFESVSRSPIYNHFSETLSGSVSIKAYKATSRFLVEAENRITKNFKSYYNMKMANRWMAMRVQLMGSFLVFFSGLAGVISKGSLNGGLVGMSINFSIEITDFLNWMLYNLTEFQTSLVSIERIDDFSDIAPEAAWILDDHRPDQNWPQAGEVVLKDYSTRYRPGLELVLKGVSCHIYSGEKIGIVGRTGAGKSSLTLSLFRIIEAAKGAIIVDKENIANFGLHDVRSRFTILPQEPFLFSGSLQSNLDPFNKYTDGELWKALEHAHLVDYVKAQPSGLQYECGEGGQNLSAGQRQLVCLARALLQRSKLLVLDEATAAVDMETDSLIQQTIRSEFSDCTILTIAHRLNTIMDYDRIMVLDHGRIAEFEKPQELLKDSKSIFYQMAKNAGCI